MHNIIVANLDRDFIPRLDSYMDLLSATKLHISSAITYSLPLLGSGFQRQTFCFVPELRRTEEEKYVKS
jgi:hypothetical protein